MSSQTKKGTRLPLVLSILLFLSICFCVWQLMEREALEQGRYREQQAAKQTQIADLEARIAFLRSLLTLTPCEAKAQWKMP